MENSSTYAAFAGDRLIASGDLRDVLLKVKTFLDEDNEKQVLIFEDSSGKQIDFDFRGTPEKVLERLLSHPHLVSGVAPAKPRTGPGRPKLGVVCREVSLLPRHWEWLQQQPSGASAALRRLTEAAMKRTDSNGSTRLAQEAAGKFMWAMAGNLPGFEEASRALYAGDRERLDSTMQGWPNDIREHVRRLLVRPDRSEFRQGE